MTSVSWEGLGCFRVHFQGGVFLLAGWVAGMAGNGKIRVRRARTVRRSSQGVKGAEPPDAVETLICTDMIVRPCVTYDMSLTHDI